MHFPAELEVAVKRAMQVEMKLQTAELVSNERCSTKALVSKVPENVKKAVKHIPANVERAVRDIQTNVQKIARSIPTSVKKIVKETISSEMNARNAVISKSTNSTIDLASNVTATVEGVVRVAVRSEMSAAISIEKDILARAPIDDCQLDVAGRKPSACILPCHDNEANEESRYKNRYLTGCLTELESDSEGGRYSCEYTVRLYYGSIALVAEGPILSFEYHPLSYHPDNAMLKHDHKGKGWE